MRLANVRGNVSWTVHQLQDLWWEVRSPYFADAVRMSIGYEQIVGTRFAAARVWASQVAWLLRALYCAFADHDKEDFSHAGPDSGNVRIGCRRCGKVLVDHWLY